MYITLHWEGKSFWCRDTFDIPHFVVVVLLQYCLILCCKLLFNLSFSPDVVVVVIFWFSTA